MDEQDVRRSNARLTCASQNAKFKLDAGRTMVHIYI